MFFNLYIDTVLVFGYKFCVIQNLSTGHYKTIPVELGTLLKELKSNEITQVEKKHSIENHLGIFLNDLNENMYGFFSTSKENIGMFPSNAFLSNQLISNVIIYLNENSSMGIILPLKDLDCPPSLFIFESKMSERKIFHWIKHISSLNFKTFQIAVDVRICIDKIIGFDHLTHIFVLNSKSKSVTIKSNTFIIKSSTSIDYSDRYSNVSPIYFSSNLLHYVESKKHNTYFHRKLFIRENGEMQNLPKSNEVYANINDMKSIEDISNIVGTQKFQKYWYVHKGLIDVCKQCEYRSMCVDNRAPVKRNEKEWFMETECNYNPYIAKWNEEEGYKSLSECGITSSSVGFKINRKKVNAINKELWGND